MSHAAPNAAAAAGRVLMSIIFLLSGFQKLARFSGTAAYMASQGLPAPDLAALVAIVVECIGGLLVLIGYRTRVVGLVLAVCALPRLSLLIPISPIPTRWFISSRISQWPAGSCSSLLSGAVPWGINFR